MVIQEVRMGGKAFRQPDRLALPTDEFRFDRLIRRVAPESRAEHKSNIAVKSNQTAIKRAIKMCRQAEPIFWIKSLGRKVGPRQNVASHEQSLHRVPRDATPRSVRGEDDLSKEALHRSRLYASYRLCSDVIMGLSQDHFCLSLPSHSQTFQARLAEHSHLVPITAELLPDLLIGTAMASKSSYPTGPLLGIQRGEVHQLHREAGRRPAQQVCNLDDYPISSVHLAEGQSEIKSTSDYELMVRPRYSGSFLHQWIKA
jgi:hypothetical protein